MNNELIEQKSWWKQNWKWVLPVSILTVIFIAIIFSFGANRAVTNVVQAYADTELYEDALQTVKSDKRVTEILGDIEPIDKLAILEGSVKYSMNNKAVNTSVRIIGTKGKAKMDIIANRIDNQWDYEKINLRIREPIEKTLEIITIE